MRVEREWKVAKESRPTAAFAARRLLKSSERVRNIIFWF